MESISVESKYSYSKVNVLLYSDTVALIANVGTILPELHSYMCCS